MKTLIVVFLIGVLAAPTWAKKKTVIRKTQSVDFTEDTVDGNSRSPDAAYLVQKRSVDFVPLYKVRENFDENIKSSVEYIK